MNYIAIDGAAFDSGEKLDRYNNGLEQLQAWADRLSGTVGVDKLRLICRDRAKQLASEIRSSVGEN